MKIKYLVLVLASLVLFQLSACSPYRTSNRHMTIPEPKKEYYPSAGKALLIVERISEANLSLYNMVLWDVTVPLNPVLIGYISPTMKVAYELEPGEHTVLMHQAAMTNILKLVVEADKTYFTMAGTDGGYSIYPFPIKAGQKNDMTRNNISVATEALVVWGKDPVRINESVQTRIKKGTQKWMGMSDEEKQIYTIDPEDGR